MHTVDVLRPWEFAVRRGRERSTFEELFEGFTTDDRVAVVAARPGDTLDAAPVLLAAVGAFYAGLRAGGTDFYRYPEFFVLHVGARHGIHSRLDVWPQSKEVVVAPDPQEVLAALNDRGITRLVLPDVPAAGGVVMRHAAQAAEQRLRTVLVAADGPGERTWTVEPSAAAVPLIAGCAEASAGMLGPDAARVRAAAAGAARHFRPVGAGEALQVLCGLGTTDEFLGFDADYRAAAGIGERVLDRDRHVVTGP